MLLGQRQQTFYREYISASIMKYFWGKGKTKLEEKFVISQFLFVFLVYIVLGVAKAVSIIISFGH